jgi:hypothetical protein
MPILKLIANFLFLFLTGSFAFGQLMESCSLPDSNGTYSFNLTDPAKITGCYALDTRMFDSGGPYGSKTVLLKRNGNGNFSFLLDDFGDPGFGQNFSIEDDSILRRYEVFFQGAWKAGFRFYDTEFRKLDSIISDPFPGVWRDDGHDASLLGSLDDGLFATVQVREKFGVPIDSVPQHVQDAFPGALYLTQMENRLLLRDMQTKIPLLILNLDSILDWKLEMVPGFAGDGGYPDTTFAWYHFNSIDVERIDPGSLMASAFPAYEKGYSVWISSRHTCSIHQIILDSTYSNVVLNRMRTLGGISEITVAGQSFSAQHFFRKVGEGKFTLFNNDNLGDSVTTLIEYDYDPFTQTMTETQSTELGVFASATGAFSISQNKNRHASDGINVASIITGNPKVYSEFDSTGNRLMGINWKVPHFIPGNMSSFGFTYQGIPIEKATAAKLPFINVTETPDSVFFEANVGGMTALEVRSGGLWTALGGAGFSKSGIGSDTLWVRSFLPWSHGVAYSTWWTSGPPVGLEFPGEPTAFLSAEKVKVYPNPASHEIQIEFPESFNWTAVDIQNYTGQRMSFNYIARQPGKLRLDVSTLATGVYLLILKGENGAFLTNKVIISPR